MVTVGHANRQDGDSHGIFLQFPPEVRSSNERANHGNVMSIATLWPPLLIHPHVFSASNGHIDVHFHTSPPSPRLRRRRGYTE
jgi:hypothetical protein